MILNYINLHNIRSYRNQRIEFIEGTNLLSGDIGSGKSSILLAAEFALFGVKKSDLTGGMLLRHGESTGFVELSFNIGKTEILVKRTLKRGTAGIKQTEGYIIVDGKKSDLMPEELRAKVFELLGYPIADLKKSKDVLFRFTVYTPQELMKEIIYHDEETRKQTIRKVFGIDKYKVIRDNAEAYLRILRSKERSFNEMIKDLPSLKEKKQQYDEKRFLLEKEKQNLQKDADGISSLLSAGESKLKAYESKINELNELKKNYAVLSSETENIKVRIGSDKDKIAEKESQIHEFTDKISLIRVPNMSEQEINAVLIEKIEKKASFQKDKSQIDANIGENSRKIDQLKTDMEHYNTQIHEFEQIKRKLHELPSFSSEDTERIIRENEEERTKFFEILSSLDTKIESHKDMVLQINKLDNCPTCHQDVSEEYKVKMISSNRSKISELEEQKTIARQKLEKIEEKLNEMKKRKEKITLAKHQKELYESKLKDEGIVKEKLSKSKVDLDSCIQKKDLLDHRKKELSSVNIEMLDDEISGLKKKIEQMRQKSDLSSRLLSLKKEIDQLKQELSDMQQKLEHKQKQSGAIKIRIDSNDVEKEYNAAKDEFSRMQEKDKSAQILLAEKKKEIEGLNELIRNNDEQIDERQKVSKKIEIISRYRHWFNEYFLNLTNIIEKHILSTVYIEFNELFQKWFSILVEEETISVSLNDEFTPLIEQNGYDTNVENLSGGEKQALALAYRLALNKVINDVVSHIRTKDLLILDEPTDGFSAQQMDKIRDVLDQADTKQIIMVSHESKLESFVQNVIRINKVEHESVVI